MTRDFLVVAALLAGGGGGGEDVMLRWRLEAPGRVFAGEAIPVRFVLTNEGSSAVRVLRWYTPLEGMLGDIFAVERGGEELAYEGAMVKRAAPGPDDYVRLAPGESATGEVDLSLGYDLRAAGTYTVAFRGRLRDAAPEGQPAPPPGGVERPVDAPGAPITVTVTR